MILMVPLPFSIQWSIEFVFLVCFFGGGVGWRFFFYMWALYVTGKYSTTELCPQPQMLPFIRILSSFPHVLMLQRLMHAMLPPDVLMLNVILSMECTLPWVMTLYVTSRLCILQCMWAFTCCVFWKIPVRTDNIGKERGLSHLLHMDFPVWGIVWNLVGEQRARMK